MYGEPVEPLERPVGFRGITHSARIEKGIRKILTGTSVPLALPANGRLREDKTPLYCLTVRLRFWQTDDS